MASIAIHCSIFLLFSLLSPSHLHARDSQFFNKMPRNNVVSKAQTTLNPQEQQPNFMQESENGGYGLYGRESTTAPKNLPYRDEEIPNKKNLPKNYNPVSYVTVPEDNGPGQKNQYYGGGKQKTTMPSDTFMQSGYTNAGENYFNNQKEKFPSTTTGDRYDQYNGGDANGFKKQGMSDTRFMDGSNRRGCKLDWGDAEVVRFAPAAALVAAVRIDEVAAARAHMAAEQKTDLAAMAAMFSRGF
nr:protein E6-like [Ipomoea batatas]